MLPLECVETLFSSARTHRFFTDKTISDNLLSELYQLVKNGPTESNFCPMRLTFVKSKEAFERVIEAAGEGNRPKIKSAPVVVIIAHDPKFHRHLLKLAPNLDAEKIAALPAKLLSKKSIYNTWLQAGFLIMAARSLGLDCGPMIGFDASKINEAFYSDKSWRASMLMNLGYGVGGDKIRTRAARLDFSEACEIV